MQWEFESSEAVKRLPDQFFANLTKRVAKLEADGHNVINLGQGNPDLPIDNQVVEKLQQAAQKPVNDQYPPFGGHDYFREAVADFYKRERSEEHTSELQSRGHLVCRLLLEKKKLS